MPEGQCEYSRGENSLSVNNEKAINPEGVIENHIKLFPEIIFIIFNTVFIEKVNKFLLKRFFTMMVLLVLNILNYRMNSKKRKCVSHANSLFLSPLRGYSLLLFLSQGLLPWLYANCPSGLQWFSLTFMNFKMVASPFVGVLFYAG